MAIREEEDHPEGHPGRFDYNPDSPAAKAWARKHVHPKGERDFPVDHPKALDTPGNDNHLVYASGVDPSHPELEAHTGRDPKTAKRIAQLNAERAKAARESEPKDPIEAPDPPDAPEDAAPAGQPDNPKPVRTPRAPKKKK